MENEFAGKLFNLFEEAKGMRNMKDTQLKYVSKYVMPNRGDFGTNTNLASGGVFDTTAGEALKNLIAILINGLTPPNLKWLTGEIEDLSNPSREEKRALYNIDNHLLEKVFNNPRSGFMQQHHQFMKDLIAYGTSCMFVERIDGVIIFNAVHLQQTYFLEDHKGMPDTVFRRYDMTARQLEAKFGEESLSSRAKSYLQTRPNEKLECVHIVMPKKDYKRMQGVSVREIAAHDFVSIHMVLNEKHILDVRGFYDMPYIISRWDKRTDEIYGTGPGIDALPNIFAANKIARTLIEVTEKLGNPPIFMNDDSVARPLNLNAGGVNFVEFDQNGRPMVQPFNNNARPQDLDALLQGFRMAIKATFFTDRIEQREGTPATATEILDNQQIRLSLTGPHINRLETEYLAPLVDRVFNLEMRAGNLPEIPASLDGKIVRFKFSSPLSKLQRGQELLAPNKLFAALEILLGTHPDTLDKVKSDEAFDYFADLAGFPPHLIRTDAELGEIRQQRAEQQQMQQGLAAATGASEVIKNLGAAGESLV